MKVIAIYNIKGGVGKTAAAANLGYLASACHCRALLCDLDPQGSVSFYFRVRSHKKFDSKKLFKPKALERFIRGSDFPNLDLLPSDISMRRLDLMFDDKKKSRKQLRRILAPLKKHYDLLILDCPPNITLLSENVFHAADLIFVPVVPSPLAMLSYRMLTDFFTEHKLDATRLKPFFSMVEGRKKLHRQLIEETRREHPSVFLETQIPYNTHVEKMGVHRAPVSCFAPRTAGARAFQQLWNELDAILNSSSIPEKG